MAMARMIPAFRGMETTRGQDNSRTMIRYYTQGRKPFIAILTRFLQIRWGRDGLHLPSGSDKIPRYLAFDERILKIGSER